MNKLQKNSCWLICLIILLANGLQIIAQEQTVQTKEEIEAVKILEKHISAISDPGMFEKIKSVETTTEMSVLGKTVTTYKLYDIEGNRSYMRQNSGSSGIMEAGFDGEKAWQKASFFRGFLEGSNPMEKSLKTKSSAIPGTSLYNYNTEGKRFIRLPDENVDGENFIVLETLGTVDAAGQNSKMKYYFDPQTFLIKRTVIGNALKIIGTSADYRKVNGITIPFAGTSTSPQYNLTNKITDLKFNVQFDPKIFQYDATDKKPETEIQTVKSAQTGVAEPNKAKSSLEKTGEISEELRLKTFEMVWKRIDDTFYDRTFNGINWQEIHDKYLPQAKQTADIEKFHSLLNKMVREMKLSHFSVSSPTYTRTLSSDAASFADGYLGLSFKLVQNQLLVSEIKKNSPADLAKIKVGFALKKINGQTPEDFYAKYKEENYGYQFREELGRVRAVRGELNGKAGSTIELELLDQNNNLLKLKLTRAEKEKTSSLEYDSKRISNDIGYVKFNLFFGDLLEKFQKSIRDFSDTKALIVDLRGNPGGAGDLTTALANLLSEKSGSLGSTQFRYEKTEFSYSGTSKNSYKGKVILLIDEGSASSSEVFSGGLQSSERAFVIGSRSAGAVLPSMMMLLPTGGGLQYVISDFKTSKGEKLESKGVVPDLIVNPTRSDYLQNRDSILEKAIDFAKKL